MTTLFDPAAHEPRTDVVWDAQRARAAIQAIVIETERAFDPDELWAPHPLDQEDDSPLHRPTSLYLGAAGVVWALDALHRGGGADLGRNWGDVALSLPARYRAEPDFPAFGVVPSMAKRRRKNAGVPVTATRKAFRSPPASIMARWASSSDASSPWRSSRARANRNHWRATQRETSGLPASRRASSAGPSNSTSSPPKPYTTPEASTGRPASSSRWRPMPS